MMFLKLYKTLYLSDEMTRSVPGDKKTFYMKGLMSGTKYTFYVVANYSNGKLPHSLTTSKQTKGYGRDNRMYSMHIYYDKYFLPVFVFPKECLSRNPVFVSDRFKS
jgi:hypothetical protein